MSHIHAGPHSHIATECTYEHTAFGVHLWCSDPTDSGGLCPGCASLAAEQLSQTGRFPPTPVTQEGAE